MSSGNIIAPPPLNTLLSMPLEDYNSDDSAVRNTWLSYIARSPAHLQALRRGELETESEAKRLGSLVHCFVLEPGSVADRYYREPLANRSTKIGKALIAEAAAANPGKVGFKPEDYDLGIKLRDAVFAHLGARAALEAEGEFEQAIFYKNADTGELCKAKYDKVSVRKAFAADLKTTLDASEAAFERAIINFRYDQQAAHYTEPTELQFMFICIEKKPPYAVAVYAAKPEVLRYGQLRRRPLLELYAQCRARNEWPGYPRTIGSIGLPGFARAQLERGRVT